MSSLTSDEDQIVSSGKIVLDSRDIPYANFPYFCEVGEILKVMIKEWKLELPKIMIFIISDFRPIKKWGDYPELESFVKGLIKGSNSTSMWILTSGLNIGFSKYIGKALQDDYDRRYSQICYRHTEKKINIKKSPLIGLCREHYLTYGEEFQNVENNCLYLQNKGNNIEESKFDLNSDHTHFLVIKSHSYRKDGSNRFLLKLMDALRCTGSEKKDVDKSIFPTSPIPIIAVLFQGDISSIHLVLSHLRKDLPLLIIKGSGGLADVFAYTYEEVRRSSQKIQDKDYIETVLRKGVRDKIISIFPSLKDNKMGQNVLCTRILECIECSKPPELKHISVLNVLDFTCNMEDLLSYMLQALFKSVKSEALTLHDHMKKDLQLTIDWNCPETALTKVFYKDSTFQVEYNVFEEVLLQKDRESFVSLFLENRFPIHKFLTAERLVELFNEALKRSTFFREVCLEGILGYSQFSVLDESFINADLNWIIESLIEIPIFVSAVELNANSAEQFDKSFSKDLAIDIVKRRAIMLLFIWSLLCNRLELAITLWSHVDQPIATALAASLILYKMLPFINESKIQEDVSENSKKFASMAFGVFDLCYNDMPSKAYDGLNSRMIEWNGLSLIDMASVSQNRMFVSHPCCQKWLTNKFMGNIKIRELPWGFMTIPVYIKVILCAFLIFPMYLWVRFKEENVNEFVGGEEYEGRDPYYLPEKKGKGIRTLREEIGRTHLLKYQYPPLWQMIFWMWSAPITKFWVSNIFYILYLVIFSLAVLWPSCGSKYLDSIVCIWTCLIAVDSAYRLFSIREAFPNTPVFLSCLEIIYMILFVIFYFLLRIVDSEGFRDPYAAKILICGALICFYYRMIFIYLPISSTLGPLLYRAKRMISVDFINFMKLVVFILIGNGIAMQAMLYPDYPFIPEMVHKSFHKAFMMFFMTPVAELTKTDSNCITWEQKPNKPSHCRVSDYVDGKCSVGIAFWPYVLVFQYVLLLKLVLMTVLVALFNNTGAQIGAEMDSIWKFQRYKLIVNFSNSLRLSPPLNIFSILIILYRTIVKCCKEGFSYLDKKKFDKGGSPIVALKHKPSAEFSYFKELAYQYNSNQEQEKRETSYVKEELELISDLSGDLDKKETIIYKAKAQIIQLETQICYTHAYLETLKYRAVKEDTTKVIPLHSLSRESPYPGTKIQRFPVPDKYVPWRVMWLSYEPLAYSMPKRDFPELNQPYVDDDILGVQEEKTMTSEKTAFLWNLESVDANGIYRNRKSWMKDRKNKPIDYRLDRDNLPRNPIGRTGLRGKGALPRWGPNHNIFVIITRWRKRISDKSDISEKEVANQLEYVETWFMKKKEISLPGGFAWTENSYETIQSCFVKDEDSESWASSDDMIKFFKDHSVGLLTEPETEQDSQQAENDFSSKLIYSGYMDDQMNTDQAWKEVETWHIHYNLMNNLYKKFKANIRWRLLTEDVFTRLPYGQTILLQDAIRPLNFKIDHI